MPCDDGTFVPNYSVISREHSRIKHVNDSGIEDLSLVSLGETLSSSSLLSTDDRNSLADELIGFTPQTSSHGPNVGFSSYMDVVSAAVSAGTFTSGTQRQMPLSVYNRTRDSSSNQVTIFNVSNIFYGQRIEPGSLILTDSSVTGSSGRVKLTIRDNAMGGLYRADAEGDHAMWANVGTIFYDEGIIVLKNPHMYYFGADQYNLSFKGEQNVHVASYNLIAPAWNLNSSSNPNFIPITPSGNPNDPDDQFVYISGVNLHDKDLNVISRTQLAQPIVKRPGQSILIRVKHDY